MQDDNINYEGLVHKQLDDIINLIKEINNTMKGQQ